MSGVVEIDFLRCSIRGGYCTAWKLPKVCLKSVCRHNETACVHNSLKEIVLRSSKKY